MNTYIHLDVCSCPRGLNPRSLGSVQDRLSCAVREVHALEDNSTVSMHLAHCPYFEINKNEQAYEITLLSVPTCVPP
jgi:hypothetical protein